MTDNEQSDDVVTDDKPPNNDNQSDDNDNANDDPSTAPAPASTTSTTKKKKVQSNYTQPPPLSKKSPYNWNNDEVVGWIASLNSGQFTAQCSKFQLSLINGSSLMTLNRTILQNDINIFDVTARNTILKEITKLKKKLKDIQKNKINKYSSTHKRKDKNTKKQIKNVDNPLKRKYIYIKKNNNTNNTDTTDTISDILSQYDFKYNIDWNKCILINKTISKKKAFMFIIQYCDDYNDNNSYFIYLFTKNLSFWNIENVFEFIRNISNQKFILFADELKRKKIDGIKLLKYTRHKLQSDYSNYFDVVLRKNIFDEINILKKQLNPLTDNNNKNKPKMYHKKRTSSDLKKEKLEKTKNRLLTRKSGPRDVGKIKYKGTKYDSSKDAAFLADKLHPLANDNKFQKRKQLNPLTPKKGAIDVGKIQYKGSKYNDANDAGFLADKLHPLSNDDKFQKRKELNPLTPKKTMKEIGKIQYKGTKYHDANDAGFLADKLHPLSNDNRFQKRKELNPLAPKKGAIDVGKIQYKGSKYDDANDDGFLADKFHPLSNDDKFQKRKELNPINKNPTVSQIGTVDGFKSPDWKLSDVVDDNDFLSTNAYYAQRSKQIINADGTVQAKLGPTDIGTIQYSGTKLDDNDISSGDIFADKIKKENKDYKQLAGLTHKAGAVEIGKIKGFDAIDYKLTDDDLMGNFLKQRAWYDSSKVTTEFDEGISHLLKSLPAHKLRIMDKTPLPTGNNTKIVWLKKLRTLIEQETMINNNGNSNTNVNDDDDDADDNDVSNDNDNGKDNVNRKTQLRQLDAILDALQDKNKNKNNNTIKDDNKDNDDNDNNDVNNDKKNKKKKSKKKKKKSTKSN